MCNLSNPIYHDADKARVHLEAIRWPDFYRMFGRYLARALARLGRHDAQAVYDRAVTI